MSDKPPTPSFRLTEKQEELRELLIDPKITHVLAWGGSRSGKTFLLLRAMVARALKAPGSRHLVARFRFNHVVQSIWHDIGALGTPMVPIARSGLVALMTEKERKKFLAMNTPPSSSTSAHRLA